METLYTGFQIVVPEEHMILIDNKPYIKYPGLVYLGHRTAELFQGYLTQTDNEIIEMPSEENGQRCTIRVWQAIKNSDGKTICKFSGIGDASPNSVNSRIVPHIIRMAETRANARALRILTDVGMTALEELDGLESAVDTSTKKTKKDRRAETTKEPKSSEREELENKLKALAKEKGYSSKVVVNNIKHILDKEVSGLSEVTDDELKLVIKKMREEDKKTVSTTESKADSDPPPETEDKKTRTELLSEIKKYMGTREINSTEKLKEYLKEKDIEIPEPFNANDLSVDKLEIVKNALKPN